MYGEDLNDRRYPQDQDERDGENDENQMPDGSGDGCTDTLQIKLDLILLRNQEAQRKLGSLRATRGQLERELQAEEEKRQNLKDQVVAGQLKLNSYQQMLDKMNHESQIETKRSHDLKITLDQVNEDQKRIEKEKEDIINCMAQNTIDQTNGLLELSDQMIEARVVHYENIGLLPQGFSATPDGHLKDDQEEHQAQHEPSAI